MNHRVISALAALAASLPCPAAQFALGPHHFTVPEGFEIEVAAGTNLVLRPIEADFDELGRLYVTDSSGSNDKVQKQLEDKPHRALRLEDADGDGRFDKSVVYADKLSFPEGAMWLDGSLFVSAPPSIWKLTDTNNDGVADVRTEWFQGKTLTGCANDLHGPYAGPDGWIYWCKGAFAKQTYTLANGGEFTTRASHIFRARPDGTGIEPVMTGGMDNPVGVAFTPFGERILCGTFFQHPEAGHLDGLIHALYGGVYGKVHDVLDGHTRTGELLPIMTHLGPAAPCGIVCYESTAFGAEFAGNLFVTCFNLHKVTRHVLAGDGATFKTRDEDFLTSDNPDFHPTDVIEDADGSLLVVDTGGWYKLCCPTSQLYKPDVLGAIYRIRRKGAPRVDDPRGTKIAWNRIASERLVDLLNDARPAVRRHAIEQLVRIGNPGVPVLKRALSDPRRALPATWALTRIDSLSAREAVRAAFASPDGAARIAAAHSASAWRDRAAVTPLVGALGDGSPHLARAAAEALGRIGDAQAVPALLAALPKSPDRALEHSIIYALIEIGDARALAGAAKSEETSARRAALIALDQMKPGALPADAVVPLLTSTNGTVKQTAAWIVSHHPDWGDALAKFFLDAFPKALSDPAANDLGNQLLAVLRSPAIQHAVAELLANDALSNPARIAVLATISRGALKDAPGEWQPQLVRALHSPDIAIVREAVSAARTLAWPQTTPDLRLALHEVAGGQQIPADVRIAALASPDALSDQDFGFLRQCLAASKPLAVRSAAATTLARAKLSNSQLSALFTDIKAADSLQLPKLLSAFSRSKDEMLGAQLIQCVSQASARASLRPETVTAALTNFPASVREQAQPLITSLNADAAKEKQRIDEMLGSLTGGDIRRGQAIFNSEKTACSSCHAIGYLGGNVGPDLTRIGQIRTERDLLEAIVFPSASFVRSYEPMMVTTRSGDDFNGILKKDAADEVVLVTGPNAEQHIARSDITDMRPGAVSVMPAGLADQLTKQEIADLLAFLKATRW